jgi:hypothetical protein
MRAFGKNTMTGKQYRMMNRSADASDDPDVFSAVKFLNLTLHRRLTGSGSSGAGASPRPDDAARFIFT